MNRSDDARRPPDPIDVHVGRAVKVRRNDLGLTQTDLGKAIGVTFQQVQKYEKGTNRISASVLIRTAQALGCDVAALFPNGGELATGQDKASLPVEGQPELIRLFARLAPGQRSLMLDLMRDLTRRT